MKSTDEILKPEDYVAYAAYSYSRNETIERLQEAIQNVQDDKRVGAFWLELKIS